jgi:hypothetical protein
MSFMMRVKSKPQTSSGFRPAMDRRQEPRCSTDRRQPVSAQLLGGVDVKLCNVSTRGVMFESSMRVLVGARVTLRLRTAARTVLLPGEVVRSRVSATRHGRLRYETALHLDSDCPLTNDELALETQAPVVSVIDMNVVDVEVVNVEADASEPPDASSVHRALVPARLSSGEEHVPVVTFTNAWGSAPRS